MKTTQRVNLKAISCGLVAFALTSPMVTKAQEAPLKPALIVIRHGEDRETWIDQAHPQPLSPRWQKVAPYWPTYELPAKTYNRPSSSNTPQAELHVTNHGLSEVSEGGKPIGEEQAVFLGQYLPGLLEKMGYAPINRIVTKMPYNPNQYGAAATPNPFDTIYPLAKRLSQNVELLLVKPDFVAPEANGAKKTVTPFDSGLKAMLPNFENPAAPNWGTLLDGKGSTLLCWDAEGLWGLKVGSSRPFNDKGILATLGYPSIAKYFTDRNDFGGGEPAKGARLYIFTKRENSPFPGYDCTVVKILIDESAFEKRVTLTVNDKGNRVAEQENAVYYHALEKAGVAPTPTPAK